MKSCKGSDYENPQILGQPMIWDKAGHNGRNCRLETHSKMESWHMYFLVLHIVNMTVQ
jgi:hypothetical protein